MDFPILRLPLGPVILALGGSRLSLNPQQQEQEQEQKSNNTNKNKKNNTNTHNNKKTKHKATTVRYSRIDYISL